MLSQTIAALEIELAKAGGGRLAPAIPEDLDAALLFGFPKVLIDFYGEGAPIDSSGMAELDQRIWSVQNAITENRDYVPGAYLFRLDMLSSRATNTGTLIASTQSTTDLRVIIKSYSFRTMELKTERRWIGSSAIDSSWLRALKSFSRSLWRERWSNLQGMSES
jgi:hypothetical protein